MRFLFPILSVLISVALFFIFVDPFRVEVFQLRDDIAKYNDALGNLTNLEKTFKDLVDNYKLIKQEDKDRLNIALPQNANNLRFILELEHVANLRNLALENVNFDVSMKDPATNASVVAIASETPSNDYDVFPVEFTITTDYPTFLNFVKDIESNLRITDIKSISFISSIPDKKNTTTTTTNPIGNMNTTNMNNSNVYSFTLKVETYWLK